MSVASLRARRRGAIVLLALLVCATAALGAATAGAVAVGGFDVRIVPPRGTSRVPAYFTPRLRVGHAATEHVLVGNTTAHTMRFHISAVDGLTGQTSGAVYANRQSPVHRAGAWVTPTLSSLSVPAGRHVRIGFTVRVPRGTPAGQYLAGLAVENAAATRSGTGAIQIRQVLRTVVGVLITVPGPAQFVPVLSSLGITDLPGLQAASVRVGLGNAGRRLAKPRLMVALTGPDGYRKTLTRHLDTILGRDAIAYLDPWPDDLAAGRYDVTATLSDGAAQATRHQVVTVGQALHGTAAHPPATPAADHHRGVPWWLLGVVLAVGLAGGLALRRRPKIMSGV